MGNLAEAFLRLQKGSDTVDQAAHAILLDPNNVKALYRRACGYLLTGKVENARTDLMRAATMSPKDRRIREALEFAKRYELPSKLPSEITEDNNLSILSRLRKFQPGLLGNASFS